MSTAVLPRCDRCRRARVLWATTARGRPIPLDPDPVDPATHGALALIGSRALGRADAVQRIRQMFDVDDVEADRLATSDYPWHIAHFATCTRPTLGDQP